jgi:hypothetical protein
MSTLEGVGDQVVCVLLKDIRDLGKLPLDVEIVKIIAGSDQERWIHPERLFMHIRHRFCIRHHESAPLCIERLNEFLERYRQLNAEELMDGG